MRPNPSPRSRPAAVLAAACALAGCAGAPPREAPLADPRVAPELAGPSYPSPARWGYHPSALSEVVARLHLPGGGCILVGDSGQRWTVAPSRPAAGSEKPDGSQPVVPQLGCVGRGAASDVFPPEPLVDVVRRSASSWLFFGLNGAVYESMTPLGAFIRTIAPPEPLLKVAGAGSTLLGVTRDGVIVRHDDQGSWKPVALTAGGSPAPALSGVAPRGRAGGRAPSPAPAVLVRVFDIAAAEEGKVLALALPEALFASEDGGATWTRSPLPPMGLSRVGAAGGALVAEGTLSSVTWDPQRTPAFARAPVAPARAEEELSIDVGLSPAAAAVRFGRAVMAGDHYYEAIRPEKPGMPWALASGPIEGPIERGPMQETAECGSIKLGASGKHLVAVCVRSAGDDIVAEVRCSDDAGARWSLAAELETPDVDRVGVAVSPDGAALITGVCKPTEGSPDHAAGGAACSPSAPILLRLEGNGGPLGGAQRPPNGAPRADRMRATLSAAPALGALAALPAFSADGRSAYFAGYRAKDDRLSLFVSHDGGGTFAPRPLDHGELPVEGAEPGGSEDPDDDTEADPRERSPSGDIELTEDSTLRPGEDGTIGLLVDKDGVMTYLTTDEDGRTITLSSPPVEGAILAGFGRRAVAIAPHPRPGGGGVELWESLDGGVSWAELPEMQALSHELLRGTVGVACGAGGCLFGDTVTRVGWGGQAEGATRAPEPPPPQSEPAVRTPIVCEMAPVSTRIDHIEGSSWGLPGGSEVMRGRAVWSVITRDPSGGVRVFAAFLPESGAGEARIVSRALLPPEPRGARLGTSIATQMEGYAAARVRIPGPRGSEIKPGTPMRSVEIAWENWMDGTSGRGTIADAGPFEIGDVKVAAGDVFDPELLSVSSRGIFVRPHSGSAKSALTFFFEPGGRLQRFEYPAWPAAAGGQRLDVLGDAVLADGQLLGVGMIRQSDGGPVTTMLLAHRAPQPGPASQGAARPSDLWDIEAVTIAPPPAPQHELIQHTDWTYAGQNIGVVTLIADPRRTSAWGIFQPFRGDGVLGPAQPLPVPYDLPDPPRPCAAAERAATARLVAPMFLGGDALFPGSRHPVLVTDATAPASSQETIVLLTSSVVLHGTPTAPCVAGWEANAVGRAPIAAVLTGDLAHAWLFRRAGTPAAAAEGSANGVTIDARPMACRFDPAAKVPDAVWNEQGTSLPAP